MCGVKNISPQESKNRGVIFSPTQLLHFVAYNPNCDPCTLSQSSTKGVKKDVHQNAVEISE